MKADVLCFDRIMEAACFNEDIKEVFGWRRKQCAVVGPDGGTISGHWLRFVMACCYCPVDICCLPVGFKNWG